MCHDQKIKKLKSKMSLNNYLKEKLLIICIYLIIRILNLKLYITEVEINCNWICEKVLPHILHASMQNDVTLDSLC